LLSLAAAIMRIVGRLLLWIPSTCSVLVAGWTVFLFVGVIPLLDEYIFFLLARLLGNDSLFVTVSVFS
jgi:hypothetical protein